MKVNLEPHNPKWAEQYESERKRIFDALGFVTDGGVIWRIAHIGATSIPKISAVPCIDILVDAFPSPLDSENVKALKALGYSYQKEAAKECFKRDGFHLSVINVEYGHWIDEVLLRDYLRAHPEKATMYNKLKLDLATRSPYDLPAYQAGKASLLKSLIHEAHRWHIQTTGFQPLHDLATELSGLSAPWQISSGWALDLFINKPSRYHDDLDIVLQRKDQLELQEHLLKKGWSLHYIENHDSILWEVGKSIPKNSHQVHARKNEEFLDILFEPNANAGWVYRRNPQVSREPQYAFLKTNKVSYLAPELVLLFKAIIRDGQIRSKDQDDFERTLPYLNAEQKIWLARAVMQDADEHPWFSHLLN